MINLSKIAPNDVVSLSGWCAYWMLGTAETHVSVYTKKLATKQWQVIRNNQVKRGQKTKVADVPPPDLFFDEFHVTLNGLHHFYSVTGLILSRDGETHARPDSVTWGKANALAAKFLTRVGVPTTVESLAAQLTEFTGYAPVPPPQAQPVQPVQAQPFQPAQPAQPAQSGKRFVKQTVARYTGPPIEMELVEPTGTVPFEAQEVVLYDALDDLFKS